MDVYLKSATIVSDDVASVNGAGNHNKHVCFSNDNNKFNVCKCKRERTARSKSQKRCITRLAHGVSIGVSRKLYKCNFPSKWDASVFIC